MKTIKQTYLMALIVIGLISLSLYSTYALFTASTEITDVVGLEATLVTEKEVFEYESITVPAGQTKTVELNISNSYDQPLYYGIWYELISPANSPLVSVGMYNEEDDTLSSGQIPVGKSFTAVVGITNNSTTQALVHLGTVGSLTSSLGIESPKRLIGADWNTRTGSAYLTLTNLGFENVSSIQNLTSFTTSSNLDGTTGIYSAEDDLGTSYYFRGNVTNNYVKFGKNENNQDMWWRIVRINGDGTIRLIYDGTQAHANSDETEDRRIGRSQFLGTDGNAGVGYMYGTAFSASYELEHTNTNDSAIKMYIDNWYESVFYNTTYEQYITDAIYCNDRTIAGGKGYGEDGNYYEDNSENITAYSLDNRINYSSDFSSVSLANPTLKCEQTNDRFSKLTSVSGVQSNGKLKFQIGLLTADEAIFGGTYFSIENDQTYLYNGEYEYWLMTPNSYNWFYSGSGIWYAMPYTFSIRDGSLTNSTSIPYPQTTDYGVRPVISLKADVLQYGTGSSTDPFRISN